MPAPLTAEDYDRLPPDNRIELVDGILRIRPSATRRHQVVVEKLREALQTRCPKSLRLVRNQELRLAALHRRDPDVMAVRAEVVDLDSCRYKPNDVVLAIEVVSPHTQIADRLHKPAEYATAGIEHYWRVEIRPKIAVHTYRLADTGAYLASGVFTEGDTVAAPGLPWAKIQVSDLSPAA